MRMFTKIGVTVATGALPVLLWTGSAGAQTQPTQSQSQSQSTVSTSPTSLVNGGGGGGTLARTGGSDDLMVLAIGGVVLGGAVGVSYGLRRRSAA